MSTDPSDFVHPIDSPHPTRNSPPSSHEEAVEEARQLTARLFYLLRVIESGHLSEGVVPVMEADRHAAADHECGFVACLVSEKEDKKLILLESIADSLTDLRKLVLPKIVGQTGVSDVRH